MKQLEYPYDSDFILRKKKAIKRELLAREGIQYVEKKIAILGGSTTSDIKQILELFLLNYGIKPAVDRIRPYITLKDTPFWDVYNTYWTAAGAHLESDPSFPSGHTSTNFEMFTALTGMLRIDGHKWAWFFMIIPFIVAVSRIIRCVHYPSDVIAGMICGLITGLLGIGISYLIFCRKKKTA